MMRYFSLKRHRLLLLSALLGVSFLNGGGFLFAQTSPFDCRPEGGSESGGFAGGLTVPEGTADSAVLDQDTSHSPNHLR